MAVIESGSSADVALVDTNSALRIATSNKSPENGVLAVTGRSDAGTVTGSILDINPEVDTDYRWRVSMDKLDFNETWAGAALNSSQWSSIVTTMTTAVSSSYLRLNASALTTLNTVARVQSYRTFNIAQSFPLQIDIPFQISAAAIGIANTTIEMGIGIVTGTTDPTDGVFVRINSTGITLISIFSGGSENPSVVLPLNTLSPNADAQMLLVIGSNSAQLWFDDVLVASIAQPPSLPSFTASQSLPLFFRVYNSAVAPATASTLLVGPVTVSTGGMNNGQTFAETIALQGGGAYQGQSGGTMGQTANWANSTEPVAGALSNTAASYTTLGGQFSFNAIAGAATDYALFAYQVPAVAAGSNNKNVLIRGIRIDTLNTGVAVATTPTILQWGLGVGSTAVSLATSEAATTKAPRRIALGVQSFVVGAVAGASAEAITINFNGPLLAEPGTFIHIIMRLPVSTATATQVIRGTVFVNAQFV